MNNFSVFLPRKFYFTEVDWDFPLKNWVLSSIQKTTMILLSRIRLTNLIIGNSMLVKVVNVFF